MQLSKLLEGLDYTLCGADPNARITRPATDARSVVPGGVFICIRGTARDGHSYAKEALRRGAEACVCDTYLSGCPCILVRDTRYAAAVIWSNFYGGPGRQLRLVGITGTNGKTSTAMFLSSILSHAGIETGTIGTLGYRLAEQEIRWKGAETLDIPASMTTPDPQYLYGMLGYMKKHGAKAVVMEVSSHALAQKKTGPLYFEAGIFTGLTPEHLDFHKDMESYFAAKASMFDRCKICVTNGDDAYGRRIRGIRAEMQMAEERQVSAAGGVAYRLRYGGETLQIHTALPGEFTIYNTMFSAIAALEMGIAPEAVEQGIAAVRGIRGRMERIAAADSGFSVYIDYAHTPAALRAALEGLRDAVPAGGRLTVVFGCGGDRDKSKRPVMGALAVSLADRVIITSDNPRTENRDAILRDILAGIGDRSKVTVIPNREEAIVRALKTAAHNEVILLAGKGHETYETGPEGKRPFSEREIVFRTLDMLRGKRAQNDL